MLMQQTQNPTKVGILATLLTISVLCSLSTVESKFFSEWQVLKHNKAAANPHLTSDSFAFKDRPLLKEILINTTVSTTSPANLTAVNYNLNWLNTQIVNATDDVINNTNPRLQASIRLDKDVYSINDVVFIEVLLLNAQDKTPVAFTPVSNAIQQYYNLTIEILDSSNNLIYNTTQLANLTSVAAYFKLNGSMNIGVYTVRAYNQFVPVVSTTFRYVLEQYIQAYMTFAQPLYKLGDTVRAIVTFYTSRGLENIYNITHNVTFGSSVLANQTIDPRGRNIIPIKFKVPTKSTTQRPVVTITVRRQYSNKVYVFQFSFNLFVPDLYVVDFFPATGYLTNNIPNKIYFQAWTNSSRVEALNITGASLRQAINKTLNVTYFSNSISTIANGKGSFMYTPTAIAGAGNVTFEFLLSLTPIVRNLTFAANAFQKTIQSEAQISILNNNRVLNNKDDLLVNIATNGSVNVSETYFLQIRKSEQILFQDQYNLLPNDSKNLTIPAASFNLVNGGILSLSLFKANRILENFYRSAILTTTDSPATTSSPVNTAGVTTKSAANTVVAATTAAPVTTKSGATTAPITTAVPATSSLPATTQMLKEQYKQQRLTGFIISTYYLIKSFLIID